MIAQSSPSYPLLRQRRSFDIFACTVIISLLLHVAASTVLFLPGRFSSPASAPVYVELQSMTAASPQEVPPAQEPAQPAVAHPADLQTLPETSPEAARLDESIRNSLRKAEQMPDAVHESAIGLGMVSGHFASFADGESLKDDIRDYYFQLMRRINEVWWTSDAAKGSYTAVASVVIYISREGKVLTCQLLQSSGNRVQDQALLDSVKRAEPLPPLPASYQGRIFNAPIRFVPPLRLMFPAVTRMTVSPH